MPALGLQGSFSCTACEAVVAQLVSSKAVQRLPHDDGDGDGDGDFFSFLAVVHKAYLLGSCGKKNIDEANSTRSVLNSFEDPSMCFLCKRNISLALVQKECFPDC